MLDSKNPSSLPPADQPAEETESGKPENGSETEEPKSAGLPETVPQEPRSTVPAESAKVDASASDVSDEDEEERQLGGRMTFLEHLDELRRRILYSVLAIVVTFTASWFFRETIYDFVARPIYHVVDKLVVIKPTEPFTIYLKASFIVSIFLASPWILAQVWLFIAPGLYRKEKHYAFPFLFFSTVLFVLGGAFAYYIVLPPALDFLLLEFGRNFQAMITAVEYFDFALLIIIGMGVIFQLPVLVAFLSIFGLITPRFLWKNFRFAFLIITIIAAVVSPTTDPFNLFLWSGPMVVLYTISIGVCWAFTRKRTREERYTRA